MSVIFVFVTFLFCFSSVFMLVDVFVIVWCGRVVALFVGGGWFVIVMIVVDC